MLEFLIEFVVEVLGDWSERRGNVRMARGLTIHFQRDADYKVVSLTVDAGRVRGIKFTKR